MAVILRMDVEQFNDGTQARFYDKTFWDGKVVNDIVEAKIVMRSDAFSGSKVYYLIDPVTVNKDRLTAFFGAFINAQPTDFISIGEQETMPKVFPDEYYEFDLVILFDGVGEEEISYTDNQGFLAFLTNEAHRVQLNMPAHEEERYLLTHVYLESAKAAATVGQITKFRRFVKYINDKINNYKVSYL